MRHAAWIVTSAVVALSALPRPASADEGSKEKAESLFKEGVRLMKEEKWEAARESLKEANLNFVTASGLYNLAVAEEKTHHPVEALFHLRAYLAHPKADPKNVSQVRTVMWPELYKATGHVRIRGVTSSVLLDRFVVGEGKVPDEVDVAPGEHTLESDGRRVSLVVAAGEVKDVDFAALRAVTPPPAGPEPLVSRPLNEPPPEAETTRWGAGQYIGGAVFVAGVAGIASGIAFAIAKGNGSDEASQLDRLCADGARPAACVDGKTVRDDSDRNGAVSTGSFIFGGVALAAGAALFLLMPKAHSPRTSLTLLPQTGWSSYRMQLVF